MRRIKIVYLASGTSMMAGSQKSLLLLLKNIDRDRFELTTVFNRDSIFGEELRRRGERVKIIRQRGKLNPFGLFNLARYLRKESFDVVHLYTTRVRAIVAKIVGLPVVERINMTRTCKMWYPSRFRIIDNFMLRFVDKIITVSKALEDGLVGRGINRNKVITIYNGVDSERFSEYFEKTNIRKEFNIDEGDFVIGTICRLVKQKGLEYLIRSMVMILKHYPSAKLLIVGDGPLKKRLQGLALRLQMDKNVIFAGAREDIPELLLMMDVFALPSLWEPLANAILEAHAASIPVVTTNVDGSPEIIINNRTGLLVEAGNSEKLADAVLYLLRNRDKAAEMAKLAKERIREKFKIEDMVKDTEKVYVELCRGNNGKD